MREKELTHTEIRKKVEDIDYGLADLFDRGLCYDQDDVILALRLLVETTLELEALDES